jgi:hypothetical protein
MKCVIVIDSSNECLVDPIRAWLPEEWRPQVTVATYDHVPAIIAMVRDLLPDLLVIHSNFLLVEPRGVIEGCAAVSPGTRFLLMTGWAGDLIDLTSKEYASLNIPVGILNMPFDKEELIAALDVRVDG